ncbi:HAAS signaling domain-containing protein [Bacillus niameyensis]|uniref:HAAS signaling domain-containing protein n=1 Tax=Bacillus niameyensis TaxID=1522308 RepID=UPI000782EDD9|nr:hypothetical protein [Bacillus niameyensis]
MNLIEIYIQEVTRRLPEKNREDIALELQSTIEDMLPDEYEEKDVKTVLEKLGNPVSLANGYRDRPMHLIGPRYFDVYVSLLKMILPIATIISFIAVVAEFFISYQGNAAVINVILDIFSFGIWRIMEVGIQTFFWLTIVFAIIERADKGKDEQPLTSSLSKWTPDDLKNIPYIPKERAVSKVEVFGSLTWTAIWATLYFYANKLVGVYHGDKNGLEFVTPVFNQEVLLSFWPIVLLAIAGEIGLALYMLIKKQWSKRLATYSTLLHLISAVIFIVILVNPNIFSEEFITYMADLFSITTKQFTTWLVSGGIFLYLASVAYNIYEGFRKSRVH